MKRVILCVDDEEIIVRSLRDQIRSIFDDEFDIEVALNAEEGLEIYDELVEDGIQIPLVISDFVMPKMNGDVFLKHIYSRSQKTLKILLTGQATMEGVVNSINDAKLYRYIAKPWEKEDLRLAITEAVKSYDRERRIEEQNALLEVQNVKLLDLNMQQEKLTNSFVEAMVSALDQRDATTAGHSKRLARMAVRFAKAIDNSDDEKFRHVTFSQDRLKQLYYAALLHDVGKIGIRENILLKYSRLSDGEQQTLRYKFKCISLVLEARIREGKESASERKLALELEETLAFLLQTCTAGFLKEEDQDRLKSIAKQFVLMPDQQTEYLLTARELENLVMTRGNLTVSERAIMESHASITYEILKNIPWPQNLPDIAMLAASHHEKIDGSGYFRGWRGDEIPLESRILAILDIYEALTSIDRPYKKTMSAEVALEIIRKEVDKDGLDRDIFELFVNEKIYALDTLD